MRYRPVADGEKFRIFWGPDHRQRFRACEYFGGLEDRYQLCFESRFARMVDAGRIANKAHFFRRGCVSYFGAGKHRLAAVIRPPQEIILLDGFSSVGNFDADLEHAAHLSHAVLHPEPESGNHEPTVQRATSASS